MPGDVWGRGDCHRCGGWADADCCGLPLCRHHRDQHQHEVHGAPYRAAEQRVLFRAVHAGHDILEITAVDGRPREAWPLVCLTCNEEECP